MTMKGGYLGLVEGDLQTHPVLVYSKLTPFRHKLCQEKLVIGGSMIFLCRMPHGCASLGSRHDLACVWATVRGI